MDLSTFNIEELVAAVDLVNRLDSKLFLRLELPLRTLSVPREC